MYKCDGQPVVFSVLTLPAGIAGDNREGKSTGTDRFLTKLDEMKFASDRSRNNHTMHTPNIDSDTTLRNVFARTETRLGNSYAGVGSLDIYSKSGMDENAVPVTSHEDLSWPGKTSPDSTIWTDVALVLNAGWEGIVDHYVMVAGLVHGIWDSDIREAGGMLAYQYYGGTWLYEFGAPILTIGFGTLDLGIGLAMSGTGVGVVLGAPLIWVGMDQIAAGITDLRTGQRGQSVVSYAGSSVARSMGFNDETSNLAGGLLPGAISLGFGLGGYFVARWTSTVAPHDLASLKPTQFSIINNVDPPRASHIPQLSTAEIRAQMNQSEIGRLVLRTADDNRIDLVLSDATVPGGYMGGSAGIRAMAFVQNTRTIEQTASTLIHEGIEALGITGTLRSEAIARLAQLSHAGVPINRATMRAVLEDVREPFRRTGEYGQFRYVSENPVLRVRERWSWLGRDGSTRLPFWQQVEVQPGVFVLF